MRESYVIFGVVLSTTFSMIFSAIFMSIELAPRLPGSPAWLSTHWLPIPDTTFHFCHQASFTTTTTSPSTRTMVRIRCYAIGFTGLTRSGGPLRELASATEYSGARSRQESCIPWKEKNRIAIEIYLFNRERS